MRVNEAGLVNNGGIVLDRAFFSAHCRSFQSDPSRAERADVYTFRVRVATIVGLSLGLWISIALFVSALI